MQPEVRSNAWWWVPGLGLALVLSVMSIYSVVSLARERERAKELAAGNQELRASLSLIQNQMQAVNQKLNELASKPAAAPAPAPEPEPAAVSKPAAPKPPAKKRVVAAQKPVDDPRWGQFQSKLDEQEKQIAGTREQMEKTRADMDKNREDIEGQLGVTKDELNGSIAKTHEEVVALQKRGQRNYYEFQLDKSKQFQRVGPVSLSLRKADFKNKRYDLMMMVDDQQLQKKAVNLYEPLRLNPGERGQPIELVVIEIHKDQVKGYISEPKYRLSEVAQR
jgi:predicted nuclease with TOPRIM domain